MVLAMQAHKFLVVVQEFSRTVCVRFIPYEWLIKKKMYSLNAL